MSNTTTADMPPGRTVVIRSPSLAAKIRWALNVFCVDDDDRVGILSYDHPSSTHGLPVVVVGGMAYGPGDLGDHELHVMGYPEDRLAATLAGYRVRSNRQGES